MNNYCKKHNEFHQCMEIGNKGIEELLPLLEQKSFQGRFTFTNKGTLSEFLKKTAGDIIFNCKNGRVWAIEVKTEAEKRTPNFFLETWSNLSRFTPGWMITLQSDILWYYFQREHLLYSIPFAKLKQWAFIKRRIYEYPEKRQNKWAQLNDTWGRCVPIEIIGNEVGFSVYQIHTQNKQGSFENHP